MVDNDKQNTLSGGLPPQTQTPLYFHKDKDEPNETAKGKRSKSL